MNVQRLFKRNNGSKGIETNAFKRIVDSAVMRRRNARMRRELLKLSAHLRQDLGVDGSGRLIDRREPEKRPAAAAD